MEDAPLAFALEIAEHIGVAKLLETAIKKEKNVPIDNGKKWYEKLPQRFPKFLNLKKNMYSNRYNGWPQFIRSLKEHHVLSNDSIVSMVFHSFSIGCNIAPKRKSYWCSDLQSNFG